MEHEKAAIVIQRMARKVLCKIRDKKNIAAAKIQKFWRKKMFIWIALLRCTYRQTIKGLHNAATTIQTKWRNWHMYKNSPLAAKYQRKMAGLVDIISSILLNSRFGKRSKCYHSLVEAILCTTGGDPKGQMGKKVRLLILCVAN